MATMILIEIVQSFMNKLYFTNMETVYDPTKYIYIYIYIYNIRNSGTTNEYFFVICFKYFQQV